MSKPYFQTCYICGAHLDPGEMCNCETTPVPRVTGAFVVGFDISSGTDISSVTIVYRDSERTIFGKDAEELYAKLAEKT